MSESGLAHEGEVVFPTLLRSGLGRRPKHRNELHTKSGDGAIGTHIKPGEYKEYFVDAFGLLF